MLTHPEMRRLCLLDGELYLRIDPYEDEYGYLCVTITHGENRSEHEKLHRLLWEFYNQREIPEGMMVRHLNDVKADNREGNLALGSHLDNMEDRKKNGGDPVGEKNPARKLDDGAVRDMRRRYDSGEGVASIHKEYNFVSKSTVASVVKRASWRHVP